MRTLITAVVLALFVSILAASFNSVHGQASSTIAGPTLGFTSDSAGSAIWPILGIPGAAILGSPLDLGTAVSRMTISPRHDYGVGVRVEDRIPVIVRLEASPADVHPLFPGFQSAGDIISMSPTGSTVALYDAASKVVQVFGHLPAAADYLFGVDTTVFPGQLRSIALNDDGSLAMLAFVGGGNDGIWLIGSGPIPRQIASAHVAAASFLPNRNDAIVADDQSKEAFLVIGVDQQATRVPLLSTANGIDNVSGFALSGDGQRAFVIGDSTGAVAIVNLSTGQSSLVSCACRPTEIKPLKGTAIFRLNHVTTDPMTVLDASSTEPRVVLIPPANPGNAVIGASRHNE